ncbi:MAG TPA: hypothetical protein PKW59_10570 [Thermotogota bacterium]|nr:hypothetical protein [Thermotogota bacterium]
MAITKNSRDAELNIISGVASASATALAFPEGDFTYNDPEQSEPIAIKNRAGELDHVKANDIFNGFGKCSFSSKYVNKDIKNALCDPDATTAVTNDGIPKEYPTVNIEYELYDPVSGDLEETIKLYNVFFDPGDVVFKEGDEYSILTANGIVFGKYDAGAFGERLFSETETAE